ncbi:MAG: DUF3035 domain-containing protein [Maricaulaceae bacterium]|nr:DUF3035 domain-containing protein [Maricaulaceae bacterium]
MRRHALIGFIIAGSLVLGACGSVRDTRVRPDEFRVVTIAPLTIPPEYNLRPPRPGELRPEEIYPDQRARAALLGSGSQVTGSDGEALLIARAGASDADPFIREIIDGESASLVRKDSAFADRILFWRQLGEPAAAERPIDAQSVSDDLRRVYEVTGGGQVQIQRDRSGFLSKLPGL